MEDAPVAHHRAALRHGDDLAERRHPVLERHAAVPAARLPAALGAPGLVQLLRPAHSSSAVRSPSIAPTFASSCSTVRAPGMTQWTPGWASSQRSAAWASVWPVALQEAELLDALEPQLEPVAGRAAPLLLRRDRLAGRELAAQQAARQRRPDHDADVVLAGERQQLVLGRRVEQVVLDLEEVGAQLDRPDAGGVVVGRDAEVADLALRLQLLDRLGPGLRSPAARRSGCGACTGRSCRGAGAAGCPRRPPGSCSAEKSRFA